MPKGPKGEKRHIESGVGLAVVEVTDSLTGGRFLGT